MHWLRRSFLAGFFVTLPLAVSITAFVWTFRVVDGWLAPLIEPWLGLRVPGLGVFATLLGVLFVGALTTNVLGKRLVHRAEQWLLQVPVFRTVYAPVRQLMAAFSPDNEFGFKHVVLVEEPRRGFVLGFVTREFTVEREAGAQALLAVYLPTNHLYLGDIVVYPKSAVTYPDLTVEEGLRVFLTGGMSLPARVRTGDREEVREGPGNRRSL